MASQRRPGRRARVATFFPGADPWRSGGGRRVSRAGVDPGAGAAVAWRSSASSSTGSRPMASWRSPSASTVRSPASMPRLYGIVCHLIRSFWDGYAILEFFYACGIAESVRWCACICHASFVKCFIIFVKWFKAILQLGPQSSLLGRSCS